MPEGCTVTVDNLEHVWAAGRMLAQDKNLVDYGVPSSKASATAGSRCCLRAVPGRRIGAKSSIPGIDASDPCWCIGGLSPRD